MTEPLVRIDSLALEAATPRGPALILRGVNLRIGRDRILGLVGESGSGKSTLALALMHLLPANVRRTGGSMTMDGNALDERAVASWRGRRLSMVFQDPATALNPVFTIGTQMIDVARRRDPTLSRAAARRAAVDALARVELPDPARRIRLYPHELSGGQRQRVMIAMALLARADLLLADEPTTALDATVEAGIVALLARLRTELGGSVLFISHHLGLVATLCGDIAVMYGGLVVESGPAAAVCTAPKHPYTAALLACEPETSEAPRFVTIPGDVPDPVDRPLGCIFAARCPLAENRCRAEPQPLRPLTPDWEAACWKAR